MYLKLIARGGVPWQNRAHFFSPAARLMRRILVDVARARGNKARGGLPRVALEEAVVDRKLHLVALDDALQELEPDHPRKSRVVELRFFGGLTVEETATVLGTSVDTVKHDWRFAKL